MIRGETSVGADLIEKGAPTSSGGRVLQGNEGTCIDGVRCPASLGHLASCPRCLERQGPIIGSPQQRLLLPSGPAARVGDIVACGCPLGSNRIIHHTLTGRTRRTVLWDEPCDIR